MATIPEREPFIQPLNTDWYRPYVADMAMLRLDVIHPVVSGNKWYKLKYNIAYALENGYKTIVTFGGPYSNHLIATAAAAKQFGIKAVGIIRGLQATAETTKTLQDCVANGMQLEFISREEYNKKTDEHWLQSRAYRYDEPFIIPEGGANEQGRRGSEEIVGYIADDYAHVCLSVGTATTFIGIRNALAGDKYLHGYAPMKGGAYLNDEACGLLSADKRANMQVYDQWHFGGLGKHNAELLSFMNEFHAINNIPLDVVYTGKMMAGVKEQLRSGFFPKDASVLCIHTGGLQGNASVHHLLHY